MFGFTLEFTDLIQYYSRSLWDTKVPDQVAPPSLAEASYGGRSPQVDREGEIHNVLRLYTSMFR